MLKHYLSSVKPHSVQLLYVLLMLIGVWLPIVRIKENRVVRGDTYRLWDMLSEPTVFDAYYSIVLWVVIGAIFLLPLITGLLVVVQNVHKHAAGAVPTHTTLSTGQSGTDKLVTQAEQREATGRTVSEQKASQQYATTQQRVAMGIAGCSVLFCLLLLVLCGPLVQASAMIGTSGRISVESGWILAVVGGVLLLYHTTHTIRKQLAQWRNVADADSTDSTDIIDSNESNDSTTTIDMATLDGAPATTSARSRSVPKVRFWHLMIYASWVVLPAVLISGTAIGWFDHFGLFKEFVNNQSRFFDELSNHLFLSMSAVAFALVAGVPLGIMAWRSQRGRTPIFLIVNTVQTIPSLALFGLIIAPLAILTRAVPALRAIGIKGIGNTPAFIALSLYALLPIVQGTFTGLGNIKRSVIDAGEGMGMTKRQIWYSIELPLSLPIMLSGIRTATIQTIGNAAIAALVGASGLGNFIFRGLGQAALDLIILGVLPIIIIAVGVDSLFSAGIKRLKISKIVMAT